MDIIKTEIDGVVIIKPSVFKDDRGYFFESFSEKKFFSAVGQVHFVQDNESKSVRNVVRGLHFQKPPHTQSKLVRVVKG
jgi:dTDP-4-dehydrorhamnose 3,5-epimerase